MRYIFILDSDMEENSFDIFQFEILKDHSDVTLAESEDEEMYKIIKGPDKGTMVRPQNITRVKTHG